MTAPILEIDSVRHQYGEHTALDGLSLTVPEGSLFGLLGPNGSGKTTLFRILTTILPLQGGTVRIAGHDLSSEPDAVRRTLGVTFQSPSLDDRLTIAENLRTQGALYGLSGRELTSRVDELLQRFGLADRPKDRVEALSGGLKRRVEIAKGLLHRPRLLLLDEPTTGLDPSARHDVWDLLAELREGTGMTVVVTTHILEEAERCDEVAIIDRGSLMVSGSPEDLRASVGGDCVTIHTRDADVLAPKVEEALGVPVRVLRNSLRVERDAGADLLRDLVDKFGGEFESVSLGRPTLEDVFIRLTGRRFEEAPEEEPASA